MSAGAYRLGSAETRWIYMDEAATVLSTASLPYIIYHLQNTTALNNTFTFTQLMSTNK